MGSPGKSAPERSPLMGSAGGTAAGFGRCESTGNQSSAPFVAGGAAFVGAVAAGDAGLVDVAGRAADSAAGAGTGSGLGAPDATGGATVDDATTDAGGDAFACRARFARFTPILVGTAIAVPSTQATRAARAGVASARAARASNFERAAGDGRRAVLTGLACFRGEPTSCWGGCGGGAGAAALAREGAGARRAGTTAGATGGASMRSRGNRSPRRPRRCRHAS